MNNSQQAGEPLPRWDLSNVYPGLESAELGQSFNELRRILDELDEYLVQRSVGASPVRSASPRDCDTVRETVEGYLERANKALALYATASAYISAFVSTDSYNATAKRLNSEWEIQGVRLQQQQVRFRAWLGSVADLLPQMLEREGLAKEHAFYLKETADQCRYMMSEAEESLAAELSLSGSKAWSRLQNVVCSQLTVPFELEGEMKTLPMPSLINLQSHPDATVRRRAYEAELAAWDLAKEPLAAAMNGIKGAQLILNKRRGRADAVHESLDQARIDRETLETMLGVMQDSFPIFRQYLKSKAKRLGQESLPWWDLFAPVGKSERRFTFAEAKDFILVHFGRFSPRLEQLARRAFENRWIDAEPRSGKSGNAFCMEIPLVEESRVLVNFDGSPKSVTTVAHELGHAYNNACQAGKSVLQRDTPMTLAETSSTFCETIVAEAARIDASSREEELALLEGSLTQETQIIVDISSRYLFEKEVFERRQKADLAADELCEIMLSCQEATYGEGLDQRYRHKYMWTWKPHYYSPGLHFYNFPYAFGLLFGIGLYAVYRERGADFVPDYESLLASNGEASAADLALRFGMDIRKPAFWEGSMKVVEGHVKRYLAL